MNQLLPIGCFSDFFDRSAGLTEQNFYGALIQQFAWLSCADLSSVDQKIEMLWLLVRDSKRSELDVAKTKVVSKKAVWEKFGCVTIRIMHREVRVSVLRTSLERGGEVVGRLLETPYLYEKFYPSDSSRGHFDTASKMMGQGKIRGISFLMSSVIFKTPTTTLPIRPIDSIEDVREELLDATEQTLVVFDIDGTLIDSFESGLFILYDPQSVPERDKAFMVKVRQQLADYGKKIGLDQKRDKINSFLMLKTKKELVEERFPELLKQLSVRGTKSIGATGCPAGRFGAVSCGRTVRYNSLRRVGIDFNLTFPHDPIIFNTLNEYNGSYPMLDNGILYTNWKNAKGSVLGAFLDRVGASLKVYMFDDLKEPLESAWIEMEKRNIPFQGYQCHGAKRHPLPPFDRSIAEVQLEYLIHYDRLLTAPQAAAIHSSRR